MEMRHGMPVFAPTDVDMNAIRRSVSRERAKVAAELFGRLRALFRRGARPPHAGATRLKAHA